MDTANKLSERPEFHYLNGHKASVSSIALLKNKKLASVSFDGFLNTWDPSDLKLISSFNEQNSLNSISVLKNDNIAVAGNHGIVSIVSFESGKEIKRIKLTNSSISFLCGFKNDNFGIVTKNGSVIDIYNPSTENLVTRLEGHTGKINAVIEINDKLIASGSADNTIKIWNTTNGAHVRTLTGHNSSVKCLTLLSNGLIASSSEMPENNIKIWNPLTGDLLFTINTTYWHYTTINAISSLGNGILATGANNGELVFWNISDPTITTHFTVIDEDMSSVDVYSIIPIKEHKIALASSYKKIILMELDVFY